MAALFERRHLIGFPNCLKSLTHLSAVKPSSSADNSCASAPAPLPLLSEATASSCTNAPLGPDSDNGDESAPTGYTDAVHEQQH